MAKRRVVLTGACGVIAGRVLSDLQDKYDLVLLDARNKDSKGRTIADVIQVDLLDRNRDAYREHFKGADAVVHCAFLQDGEFDYYNPDRFWMEHDNVKLAYNVFMTCQEEKVRRVVIMSSNHATDYYENLFHEDRIEFITPEMPPASDNFYGWAKISYEALGFSFACGGIGAGRVENVHLRIGGPRETDIDNCGPDNLKKMHRALGAYLSQRDEVQLIVKSVETESIADDNGVPFQIFYGISGNTHNFWSIQNARRVIGYEPQDDSQVVFSDKIAAILQQAKSNA
jgi:hypothetical protein